MQRRVSLTQSPAAAGDTDDTADLGLPLPVVNDGAHPQQAVRKLRIEASQAVREAVGTLLKHDNHGSHLWTAFATREAALGSIKVRRFMKQQLHAPMSSRQQIHGVLQSPYLEPAERAISARVFVLCLAVLASGTCSRCCLLRASRSI